MRLMSLNTHSWIEDLPEQKLKETADFIMQHDPDVIALQEVNQLKDAEKVETTEFYCQPINHQFEIKSNNYAKLLVDYLAQNGYNYYWSWTCSHIGYDIYEEGSAILAKKPFKAETVLVSKVHDLNNYLTRQLLFAHFDSLGSHPPYLVGSCHYSWWENDFQYEWNQTLHYLASFAEQVFLLGDFNNPAHLPLEGYDEVTQTYYDMYECSEQVVGEATVEKKIDGWSHNTEALRIDFGFMKEKVDVRLFQVVLNGQLGPVVSDHYGIMIEVK